MNSTARLHRVALAGCAVLAGATFAEAATLHFNQADINFGELLEGATPPEQILTLGRSFKGGAASATVSSSPGLLMDGSQWTGSGVHVPGNDDPNSDALTVALDGLAGPGVHNWTVQLLSPTSGEDGIVNLTATILAHANGSFDGSTDLKELVIDFGDVALGSVQSLGFNLFNLPHVSGYTADLDLDSFLENDPDNRFSTDLSAATIVAGQSAAYTVNFDTSTLGSFTAQYTLNLSDEDLEGEEDQVMTITVLGAVIPEPASLALLGVGTVLLARRRS